MNIQIPQLTKYLKGFFEPLPKYGRAVNVMVLLGFVILAVGALTVTIHAKLADNKQLAHSTVISKKQTKSTSTPAAPTKTPVAPSNSSTSSPVASTPTPAAPPAPVTTSCDKNGALFAYSQLSTGEQQEASQYAAVPLLATTENELIMHNTSIGSINIALNTDWTLYINFMSALNCPVVTTAPAPYPLQPDPGNLPQI